MEELSNLCHTKPELKPYLQKKVFPTLQKAFEALLEEIEFYKKRKDTGEDLPEIQPLLFLAQYLMRNNPNPIN